MENTRNQAKSLLLEQPDNIYINQMGYLPDRKKVAVIRTKASTFQLLDMDHNVCFEGDVEHFGIDENSGDDVYLADFSQYDQTGVFYIQTKEGDKSIPFSISKDVYAPVLYDTMRAFYYLRCGCGLEEKFAGKFHHDRCHVGASLLWEDHSVTKKIIGGWHDAGDYGRYVTAGACACAHLLYAFLLFPKAMKELKLHLPEEGGTLPEVLAECKYELDWLLQMQREDGAVYHKQTTAHHAAFVMPENDVEQMFLLPISSMATADFAAVCALAARCFQTYDEQYSQTLLEAAKRAGNWLQEHDEPILFSNPEGCGTGEYGESTDVDNRFWAWSELYATTKEEHYHDLTVEALKILFSHTDLGYANVGGLGSLAYILCSDEEADPIIKHQLEQEFLMEAKTYKELADACGYGVSLSKRQYGWGSNMNVMKNGMIFILADRIEGKETYREYAIAQLHYLLGVNATGYSYITGSGAFSCNFPHLRPAFADGVMECIPGMVSGGPNAHPCDEVAMLMIPEGTPPMKCYLDDVNCYSLNEITIYWNSVTVFVLAYLSDII